MVLLLKRVLFFRENIDEKKRAGSLQKPLPILQASPEKSPWSSRWSDPRYPDSNPAALLTDFASFFVSRVLYDIWLRFSSSLSNEKRRMPKSRHPSMEMHVMRLHITFALYRDERDFQLILCPQNPIMGLFLSIVLFSEKVLMQRERQAVFKNRRQFLRRHLK